MGSYVKNHLILDEHVEYETKPHWIIFFSMRALFSLFLLPILDYWSSEYAMAQAAQKKLFMEFQVHWNLDNVFKS